MRIRNIALLLGATVFLAGCLGRTDAPVTVSYTPVAKPELLLPTVDKFNGREVDYIVITEENFDEVVADLRAQGKTIVFFAVTEDGYENLSINTANIRKLVQQQAAIIAAYERYYEEVNEAIDSGNAANGN